MRDYQIPALKNVNFCYNANMTNSANFVFKPPESIPEKLAWIRVRLTTAMHTHMHFLLEIITIGGIAGTIGGTAGAFYKTLSSQKVAFLSTLKFRSYLPALFLLCAVSNYAANTVSHIYKENVRKVHVNKKIKKIADQSLGNSKSSLVIRADLNIDHNNVFSTEGSLLAIRMLAKTHSIKCIHGYSDTLNCIRTDVKNSQKYDLILVQGHGDQYDVPLDSNGRGLSKLCGELPSELTQILKENGRIILGSCSTGKGENNIARTLSIIAPVGTAVYAAPCPVTAAIRIDKNGNAQFRSMEGNDITHIFQNGKLIFSSL